MNEQHLKPNQELYHSIAKIIIYSKSSLYRTTNIILLNMYWEIGKLIVQDEQNGEKRAGYGNHILKNLANQLSLELAKVSMKEI